MNIFFNGLSYRDFIAVLTAAVLFALLPFWVEVSHDLHKPDYYQIDLLNGLRARAFLGTIARLLNLSPQGFVQMLQFLKFGWLLLICLQFFRWIQDRAIAFLLCVMFAFTCEVFINDHISGFIDVAMNFWLLAAASLLVRPASSPAVPKRSRFLIAFLLLSIAVLTHEIAIIVSISFIGWSILRYRGKALALVAPWGLCVLYYLWFTWRQPRGTASGFPPEAYWHILSSLDYFIHEALSMVGLFTSIGMLWGVYAVLGWIAVRGQKDTLTRYGYAAFVIIGLLSNLATQLVASDAQRMVGGVWLPLFILIIDQADVINHYPKSPRVYGICSLACFLQILIPPMFISGQHAVPLNCYAEKLLPAFSYKGDKSMWKLQYNPPEHFDGVMKELVRCVTH